MVEAVMDEKPDQILFEWHPMFRIGMILLKSGKRGRWTFIIHAPLKWVRRSSYSIFLQFCLWWPPIKVYIGWFIWDE